MSTYERPDIYGQHDKAFAAVSAFVVIDPTNGERVATVAIKFPRDGAGRLYAYVHWIGLEMVRGFAGGYGYDKRSAAVADAARKLPLGLDAETGTRIDPLAHYGDFKRAAMADAGDDWTRAVEKAGFRVLQAV